MTIAPTWKRVLKRKNEKTSQRGNKWAVTKVALMKKKWCDKKEIRKCVVNCKEM